jgi:hypothetical protein
MALITLGGIGSLLGVALFFVTMSIRSTRTQKP